MTDQPKTPLGDQVLLNCRFWPNNPYVFDPSVLPTRHSPALGGCRQPRRVSRTRYPSGGFWPEHPDLVAGKDLLAGGTWLGCTRTGRFAALTNFSQDTDPSAPRSRGGLVHEFLISQHSAMDYAESIDGPIYAGFNLLLFDGVELVYASNIATGDQQLPKRLAPGSYGLSNAELGAAWPKCTDGAEAIAELAAANCGIDELLEPAYRQRHAGRRAAAAT